MHLSSPVNGMNRNFIFERPFCLLFRILVCFLDFLNLFFGSFISVGPAQTYRNPPDLFIFISIIFFPLFFIFSFDTFEIIILGSGMKFHRWNHWTLILEIHFRNSKNKNKTIIFSFVVQIRSRIAPIDKCSYKSSKLCSFGEQFVQTEKKITGENMIKNTMFPRAQNNLLIIFC